MTLEEIKEAVGGSEELLKGVVQSVNSTDYGKEVLKNFADSEFDKRVGNKISELHTRYDEDIFEVLGERKKTDQKSYDYVKQIAGELKELRSKNGSGSSERIKTLENELKTAREIRVAERD